MSASNPESNESAPPSPKSATRGKSDPAWGHGAEQIVQVNNKNVKVIVCLHCSKSFQGGGVNRFKKHLAGVRGDVAPCKKVPGEVRFQMQQSIDEFANKRRRLNEVDETHSEEDQAPVDLTNEDAEIGNMSTPSSSTSRRISRLDASKKRSEATKSKAIVVRILGQTCSSSGCERNWSVFEFIHSNKRNRMEHQRLNDLVYVRYNLRLHQRISFRGRNYDPISFEEFAENGKWILEDDPPILTVEELEEFRKQMAGLNIQANEETNEGNEEQVILDGSYSDDEIENPNNDNTERNENEENDGEDSNHADATNNTNGPFLTTEWQFSPR